MGSQEVVDNYDPSLMFAIPRLAIVYGLLICTEGPLNVDRSHSDFPSLFLPFKNLLRKIRELLQTLEPSEVMVLELLLCQLEEPANIATKLKEVERMLENKENDQALKLQAKLNGDQEQGQQQPQQVVVEQTSRIQQLNSIPCQCDNVELNPETAAAVSDIINDIIRMAVSYSDQPDQDQQQQLGQAVVEIDCTSPEITVQPRNVEIEVVQQSASGSAASSASRRKSSKVRKSSDSSGLKRHNARRDTKRVPYKYQKDRRSKFKSTEDLIHRLYVCISGAADQLQSNYAADFRSILRVVFSINVSQDPIEEEEEEKVDLSPEASEDQVDHNSTEEDSEVQGAAATTSENEVENDDDEENETITRFDENQLPPIDLGSDALQNEMSASLINQMLRSSNPNSESSVDLDDSGSSSVYAQNLDLHLQTTDNTDDVPPRALEDPEQRANEFFQPEPTLLDIASGVGQPSEPLLSPQETLAPDNSFVYRASNNTTPRRRAP